MRRLVPFLALLLVGCSNLSGTRDYTPTPGPVNTNDFSPLPVRHSRVLMLSQPVAPLVVHRASLLPPEPSIPMLLRTNAAAPKPTDRVIAFRYPTNTFYDVLASPDPTFQGGVCLHRNCSGQSLARGDIWTTNTESGRLFFRVIPHATFWGTTAW